MSIPVSQLTTSQTFGAWLQITNYISQIISTNTVTADSSLGGSLTSGNSFVNGHFGSNNLHVSVLSGGNLTSTGVLTITTNATINSVAVIGNTLVNTTVGWTGDGNNAIITTFTNSNSRSKITHTNSSNGVSASADLVLYDTLGVLSNNFIDMGIRGSYYTNTQWTIGGASDGYVYVGNTNLSIGTAGAKYVNFFTNGTESNNEVMRLTAGANVGIGNKMLHLQLQVLLISPVTLL